METRKMTPSELDKLEELCEKATPGPWSRVVVRYNSKLNHGRDFIAAELKSSHNVNLITGQPNIIRNPQAVRPVCRSPYKQEWDSDAEFIAAARTALPELITQVKRLTELYDVSVVRGTDYEGQRDALQSKLTVAREALEEIDDKCFCDCGASNMAGQALKSIEEG